MSRHTSSGRWSRTVALGATLAVALVLVSLGVLAICSPVGADRGHPGYGTPPASPTQPVPQRGGQAGYGTPGPAPSARPSRSASPTPAKSSRPAVRTQLPRTGVAVVAVFFAGLLLLAGGTGAIAVARGRRGRSGS